jgi:hypothetical protein
MVVVYASQYISHVTNACVLPSARTVLHALTDLLGMQLWCALKGAAAALMQSFCSARRQRLAFDFPSYNAMYDHLGALPHVCGGHMQRCQ